MSEISARRWLVQAHPNSLIQNLKYEDGILTAHVDGEAIRKSFRASKRKRAKKAKKA